MQDSILVSGMVVSASPVGEADRRVVLITRELGRISCFARGARKPTSMLVGCTRSFAFGKFQIRAGRDSYTLYRAEISEYFEPVVRDITASAYGCYFLELASYFTREGMNGTEVLKLLYYSMKALENEHLPDLLVRRVFELKLLSLEGLLPEPSEKDALSQSTCYTVSYIENSDTGKLFTFIVKEEVQTELARFAEKCLSRNVDRALPAREMLEVLA